MKIIYFITLFFSTACFAQSATFTYQYHNEIAKAGRFTLTTPDAQYSFEVEASAGYLGAANNPYFQLTKDLGPLPSGTWEIYAFKDQAKSILRLRPTDDVNMPNDSTGKPIRDGFLIHGVLENETPEEASTGCIIVAPKYRKKLGDAFKKYGVIKLSVTNIVTGDNVN